MIKPYRFTVAGWGSFPTDMLRYDRCWPATQQDVYNVVAERCGATDLRIVELCGIDVPTKERWASFSWKVVSVTKI